MSQTANPWLPLFITIQNLAQTARLSEPDAEYFVQKATKSIDSAKNEITYAETISSLLSVNENGLKECHRSLANIGVWHLECAVELFQKAIRNFELATKRGLLKDEKIAVEAQIKDCQKQIGAVTKQKDSAENLLNSITN